MNINKFTEKAQEAILAAQKIAEDNNNSQIEVEHLLLALLNQPEGVVPQIVRKLGADPRALQQRMEDEVARMPKVYGAGQLYISPRLKKVLDNAQQEAERLKDEYVSADHLLIAIADDQDKGPAQGILREFGISRDRIYQILTSIRGNQRITDQNPEAKYEALEKYGRDLTDMAHRRSRMQLWWLPLCFPTGISVIGSCRIRP